MRAALLFSDKTAQWDRKPGPYQEDRLRDLKLAPVLDVMAGGDPEVRDLCRQVLEAPLCSREEIEYRQEILRECAADPQPVEQIYEICVQAEEKRKNTWCRLTSPHLTTVYSSAEDLLKIYMEALVEIRRVLEPRQFSSRGLRQLRELLAAELSDAYLDQVRSLRSGIEDKEGTLISARLGPGLQGVSYVKRQPKTGLSRLRWLVQPAYTLADRDMQGARDLEMRKDRAINAVANVMAQAAGSLQSFTDQLRKELSFYLGGIRLWQALTGQQQKLCFPEITEGWNRRFEGLYDGSLALTGEKPVGSSVTGKDRHLWLITGANQGGKTTFLRSLGLCQLMGQCGLFVFAESCSLPIRRQILTHFSREEDRDLASGRLDEELGRMSRLLDHTVPGTMLLSNESFSSTNDRDGSEIFAGLTQALLERGVEVLAVTHLMDYAQVMGARPDVLCLQPERREDGARTYRILPGQTGPGTYAGDIYEKIFAEL